MRAAFFFIVFLGSISILTSGQQSNTVTKNQISITQLTNDMKRLVELNIPIKNGLDLSGNEAENLNHATVSQLIQVTTPYLNSAIPNSRNLCQRLLMHALLYQVKNEADKQKVVEILCAHFLDKENFHFLNTTLLVLTEKDFNKTAKKHIARLIDDLPGSDYGLSAQFLSVAQIKQSIPLLWKFVDTNFKTMQREDIDVLASLARMKEKRAGILLCEYYNSDFNKWGDFLNKTGDFSRHFFIAKNLAFSLDSTVLSCLIKEFRAIDINYSFRDGDYGFYPAQYLGACIASMIKNYPFDKEDYSLKPKQLLDWVNNTNDIQIKDR
ncbi:MAG TPA: hypothetical protein VFF27_14655 [Bacteroidia bacterium]|jgi:hypothetical protein|nr:hypothetical protein [Bacteroidia bacterium]